MSPVGARKQNRHRFWVDFENFPRGRYAPNKPYDDRLLEGERGAGCGFCKKGNAIGLPSGG